MGISYPDITMLPRLSEVLWASADELLGIKPWTFANNERNRDGNGQECLDILQSETVDVCVLDIMMPVMDGIAALQRIKEEHPGLKRVMLSAMSAESCIRQTLQLGADAYVVKPFSEQCLLERAATTR